MKCFEESNKFLFGCLKKGTRRKGIIKVSQKKEITEAWAEEKERSFSRCVKAPLWERLSEASVWGLVCHRHVPSDCDDAWLTVSSERLWTLPECAFILLVVCVLVALKSGSSKSCLLLWEGNYHQWWRRLKLRRSVNSGARARGGQQCHQRYSGLREYVRF